MHPPHQNPFVGNHGGATGLLAALAPKVPPRSAGRGVRGRGLGFRVLGVYGFSGFGVLGFLGFWVLGFGFLGFWDFCGFGFWFFSLFWVFWFFGFLVVLGFFGFLGALIMLIEVLFKVHCFGVLGS